jgi:hypothetical protein
VSMEVMRLGGVNAQGQFQEKRCRSGAFHGSSIEL